MVLEVAKEMLNELNDVDQINRMIYDIWFEYFEPLKSPLPGFISPLKKDTLLVLGFNPSFNPGGYKNQLLNCDNIEIRELADVEKFQRFMKQSDVLQPLTEEEIIQVIEKVISIDKCIEKNGHKYINKLEEYVLTPLGLEKDSVMFWDLFSFRCNKQRDLKDYLSVTENQVQKWTQLLIALRVIELCEPKMIILPNSGGGDHLLEAMKHTKGVITFSEEYGTHLLKYNNVNCPIFLSANLHSTGQLDKYSRKRYTWHVNQIWTEVNQQAILY
ncbi:hypothetical protein [Psychrobacillus sp. FSL K6-1415]|uniref:hypothetical protein n=1 Tax=Psychrobacillus sp. FSL K6-1415 TaxID=2921544 RepID=UPI0030F558C6